MDECFIKQIEKDIEDAFSNRDFFKIKKETLFLFDRVVYFLLSLGRTRLEGITFPSEAIQLNKDYLTSKTNKRQLYKMLREISLHKQYIKDTTFGQLRIDLERWFLAFGGKEIYFHYKRNHLYPIKKAAQQLSVSEEKVKHFITLGLEAIKDDEQFLIPKHAIRLWQDPVYAIRQQMLYDEKKQSLKVGI